MLQPVLLSACRTKEGKKRNLGPRDDDDGWCEERNACVVSYPREGW